MDINSAQLKNRIINNLLLDECYKASKKKYSPSDGKSFQKSNQKFFVIKYGHPSSGKGSIVNPICSDLGIQKYIDINVDLYVEIIANKAHIEKGKITQPIYWKLRSLGDTPAEAERKKILDQSICSGRTPPGPADALSDMVLDLAIKKGQNIMWETMGKGNIDWIIDLYIKKVKAAGYKTVVAIPLVKIEKNY